MTTSTKPGLLAGRFLKARAICGSQPEVLDGFLAAKRWLDGDKIKAAVAAQVYGDHLGSGEAREVGRSFMAMVRERSVVGRLLAAGLVQAVPDRVQLAEQTGASTAGWIDETDPIAVSAPAFTARQGLRLKTVSAMTIATKELLETEGSESILLADLARATAAEIDAAFLDPTNAGSTAKPKSILAGATSIPSAGADAESVREDIQEAVDNFAGDLETAIWITSPKIALSLSLMQQPLGDTALKLAGTSHFFGLPLLTSKALEGDSSGGILALVDARRVQIAGAVDAQLDIARQATVQADDAPDNPTTASTVMTNLWQRNLVGLRAQAFIDWRIGANSAVFIDDVAYNLSGT